MSRNWKSLAEMVKTNKRDMEKEERILDQESAGRKGAGNEEVRRLNWEETIVITRRDFHDDWSRILSYVKEQTESSYIINPFQADKALMKCPSKDLACLLLTNKGWVTFGPVTVKLEAWNPLLHGRAFLFPSYGNWVKIRNIPLHLWSLATFKAIGNALGGFIDYDDNNSCFIECFDVAIKVKSNYCGFIPAEISSMDGPLCFQAKVVSFEDSKWLARKDVGIHGGFSSEAARSFHQGSAEQSANSIDRWRLENGCNYPGVNIQYPNFIPFKSARNGGSKLYFRATRSFLHENAKRRERKKWDPGLTLKRIKINCLGLCARKTQMPTFPEVTRKRQKKKKE
ncbi:uncharacterized protein LOC111018186 [Momordica charantia]|uniref:Uncharacterized protein LOC111018186 n=1 Tax=Momordica charantia TaxID=3673 RepID=A0A6J1D6X4_MOMCH|nr:uncharacterized protein LOC111018186 [Momordica charantia]XP_022149860.1 uncharacterized protein LOC111018186 [Momordica charantia]